MNGTRTKVIPSSCKLACRPNCKNVKNHPETIGNHVISCYVPHKPCTYCQIVRLNPQLSCQSCIPNDVAECGSPFTVSHPFASFQSFFGNWVGDKPTINPVFGWLMPYNYIKSYIKPMSDLGPTAGHLFFTDTESPNKTDEEDFVRLTLPQQRLPRGWNEALTMKS
jgi:hypothetical protein